MPTVLHAAELYGLVGKQPPPPGSSAMVDHRQLEACIKVVEAARNRGALTREHASRELRALRKAHRAAYDKGAPVPVVLGETWTVSEERKRIARRRKNKAQRQARKRNRR